MNGQLNRNVWQYRTLHEPLGWRELINKTFIGDEYSAEKENTWIGLDHAKTRK